MLNAVGYGMPGGPALDLVYNPGGAFLPPSQAMLEDAYRQELRDAHGIEFSHLLAFANVPITRWFDFLEAKEETGKYMHLLVQAFNPAAAAKVMCKETVSVGWDGALYDCDFNQQLDLCALRPGAPGKATVHSITSLEELEGARIRTLSHCFACTAGEGSS